MNYAPSLAFQNTVQAACNPHVVPAESEDVYCIKLPFPCKHCMPTRCRCRGDRTERLQGIARRCSLPPKLFTDSFIPEYLSRLPPDLEQKVRNHKYQGMSRPT